MRISEHMIASCEASTASYANRPARTFVPPRRRRQLSQICRGISSIFTKLHHPNKATSEAPAAFFTKVHHSNDSFWGANSIPHEGVTPLARSSPPEHICSCEASAAVPTKCHHPNVLLRSTVFANLHHPNICPQASTALRHDVASFEQVPIEVSAAFCSVPHFWLPAKFPQTSCSISSSSLPSVLGPRSTSRRRSPCGDLSPGPMTPNGGFLVPVDPSMNRMTIPWVSLG